MIIQSSKINLGLPQIPEGVPPELFSQFLLLYNATRNLANALSLYGGVDAQPSDFWSQLTVDDTIFDGNLNRWYVKANEAVSFGEVVSPILSGAELQVRLANATNNTRWACGIVNTVGITPIGSFCEVIVGRGMVTGISGMVAGSRYWLSTTNGAIANTPAVAAGNIEQYAGFALASNRLLFDLSGNFIQH